MSSTLSRRGLLPDKPQFLLLPGLHPVLLGPLFDQRHQLCQQDHLLPPSSPSRQRQLNRLQLHLSSSLQTASRHKLSQRNPSLPSLLLLDKKCLSNLPSRHSRPSRPDLNRSNSSLASPSSHNSQQGPPCHLREDRRWSTRCSTPAVSSPRTSLLQRTPGTVSTSLILLFCDLLFISTHSIFSTSWSGDTPPPGSNKQCANKWRQPAPLPCCIELSSTSFHLAGGVRWLEMVRMRLSTG